MIFCLPVLVVVVGDISVDRADVEIAVLSLFGYCCC